VRQLAEELRVNFNTVARAYRILDEAGVISTQQGRGTYIWSGPHPEMTNWQRSRDLDDLTRRFFGEALKLGCSEDDMRRVLEAELYRWKEHGEVREE